MTCTWAPMLPAWLLLLTLLVPQALSAGIPNKRNLAPRHSVPVVPDAHDPAFSALVLEKVNKFRSHQDAGALQYDAGLASYAASLANQCNIDSRPDDQYGDILTGGSPSIFGRDSWDGFTLNDAAAHLIQGWYYANVSYIADPTFHFLPFGRSYTQLVWKATTHIGCAWTPASCKFEPTSAFYLRCAFSPKGNIQGQFEENVSCNGCSRPTRQGESSEPSRSPERRASGPGMRSFLLERINKIRSDALMPAIKYSNASELIATALAQNCSLKAQKGETIGPAIFNNSGVIPSFQQATQNAIDAWNSEPHTTDLVRSPNYAQIIAKDVTDFGCWYTYSLCPGAKRYMHCFFGNRNEPGWDEGASPPKLEERQSSVTGSPFGDLLLVQISSMRAQAQVPDIKWDQASAVVAKTLSQKCGGKAQKGEILSPAITILPGFDATNQAIDAWNREPHTTDPAMSPSYAQIIAKDVTVFGCGWNDRICHGGIWYLHCFFGSWNVGAVSNVGRSLSIRQSGDLNVDMDKYSVTLVQAVNRIRNESGRPEVVWSRDLVARAREPGAKCSDFKGLSINEVTMNYTWWTVLDPKPNFELMSNVIGGIWNTSKPAKGQLDHDNIITTGYVPEHVKITLPQWKQVGCAWSSNCTAADNYILYCKFSDVSPTTRSLDAGLVARQKMDASLQDTMGPALAKMRQLKGLAHPAVLVSGAQATQAQTDADKCDGTKDNTLYEQAMYRHDEANGKLSTQEMTFKAIDDWFLQANAPDPKARQDWDVVTTPNNKQFGCAWWTKCGTVHYLYCSFYHG